MEPKAKSQNHFEERKMIGCCFTGAGINSCLASFPSLSPHHSPSRDVILFAGWFFLLFREPNFQSIQLFHHRVPSTSELHECSSSCEDEKRHEHCFSSHQLTICCVWYRCCVCLFPPFTHFSHFGSACVLCSLIADRETRRAGEKG